MSSITTMKKHVKQLHKLVAYLGIEEFFIKAKKYIPSLVKLIPLNDGYKPGYRRIVKRDGVLYDVLLSDYMQWHIFADLPDLSWKKASEYVNNNSSIIDVGANSGAFTLKLAQYAFEKNVEKFKIYAFEPNPIVFVQLANNLKLNPHLGKYVTLVKLGLGEHDEKVTMNVSDSNSGGGKITQGNPGNGLEIEITSLDKFVSDNNLLNISFVKIDVEGFEPLVIVGGKNTIENILPDIYIEMTDEWFKKHNSSQYYIINYFKKMQYELFIEDNDKFVPIADIYANLATMPQYNLLAISEKNIHKAGSINIDHL